MNLIPTSYPPHTLLIPTLIPCPDPGSRPNLIASYPGLPRNSGSVSSSLSLLEGIRGYEGIRAVIGGRLFPHTLQGARGMRGYEASLRRSPICAICGGSGLDFTRPRAGGGYEACTRCLIPADSPADVHPGWRPHLPADRRQEPQEARHASIRPDPATDYPRATSEAQRAAGGQCRAHQELT